MILLSLLIQDLRYGARVLYRNRGFTCVAVFALALGIGVNTVVFTACKAILTRPLNAYDSKEMVNIALLRDLVRRSSSSAIRTTRPTAIRCAPSVA